MCAAVVYVYYNTGIRIAHINVRWNPTMRLILWVFETSCTRDSFVTSKTDSLKKKQSFVGMLGLETGFSEGNDYNLEMCGTHDHLNTFPQSMFNSSYVMLHCLASYVSQFMH